MTQSVLRSKIMSHCARDTAISELTDLSVDSELVNFFHDMNDEEEGREGLGVIEEEHESGGHDHCISSLTLVG